jgi:NADH:ubiquinone oxidoreductase subunit 2 (subunit N)
MQGFPHTAVRKTWNFCMPAYKEYLNIPVNKSVNSPFLSKDYIRLALPVSNLQNSVNVIMFFLLVGFLFKLAVFPVHGWALDVYSGLSYSTLNIFLNVIKILFSYKLIQVFFYVFQYYTPIFVSVTEKNILFFVSISSII